MCIKGMNGITLADAQAILVKRGLACSWWRNARQISSSEIDERLTSEELDLHVNSFDEKHPTRGGLVREETPFISLTAGSVERNAFWKTNEINPAHRVALNFATSFGGSRGDCFLFYCWVLVAMRPSVHVRHLAEEVRELTTYRSYSHFQPEGEIAAKIEVPARQIDKLEHYRYGTGDHGRQQITLVETYKNSGYIRPHDVTNYRDWL
jgi:hypothetical protein